ncbi:M48 family metallopeptidase [Novosphingobium piscinae]|uniref:M48 family metallopeptidase n=1 Tax=Novosphingobium piscinae TaxID=1507448 RepID=A0A7X1G1C4_9SPHN|nr:SprT family zinc-dependent metalloprotease [Novosphingobium piscinae]MBC2670689.1 M48 family metallopeptidase [Novosphingobium piscinae]
MLDWLRRDPRRAVTLTLAGREVPVEVRRLAHARRLTLRLAPDGSAVRITIPRWTPTGEALEFARSRQDWLERQLERLVPPQPLAPGASLPWRGVPRLLLHDATARRGVTLEPAAIRVGGAVESLVPRLRRWVQAEARSLFQADLADYAPRAGVSLPPLALTSAQRRWGSCSTGGVVRLNWRLALAPDAVRRSVVAHEVAHLVHFDHSPRFHALLATLFEEDLAVANTWLKAHGRTLYAPFG